MSVIFTIWALSILIFPLFWDGSGIWVIGFSFDRGSFSGICPFVCFLFLFCGCEFGCFDLCRKQELLFLNVNYCILFGIWSLVVTKICS